MKKNYITPAVSIIRVDNSLMQIPISGGEAAKDVDCDSKKGTINFYDDDEDGIAAGW